MNAKMATTQWSRVLAARDGSDTEARAALEELCRTYWEPLYAFVRRQGATPADSADLTQGYFTELLDKDFLSAVDPSKGKFRSFLLTSLKHFLSHERDRAAAAKRGGGTPVVSLDLEGAEERLGLASSEEMSPEEAFEHRWAVTMVNRALTRLRELSIESGTERQFEVLKPYLTGQGEGVPYREVAGSLGTSEEAVRMAVSRLRKRLGKCLRAEVAETVAAPAEIDAEVRHIITKVRL